MNMSPTEVALRLLELDERSRAALVDEHTTDPRATLLELASLMDALVSITMPAWEDEVRFCIRTSIETLELEREARAVGTHPERFEALIHDARSAIDDLDIDDLAEERPNDEETASRAIPVRLPQRPTQGHHRRPDLRSLRRSRRRRRAKPTPCTGTTEAGTTDTPGDPVNTPQDHQQPASEPSREPRDLMTSSTGSAADRICENCNETLVDAKPRRRFCSTQCQQAAYEKNSTRRDADAQRHRTRYQDDPDHRASARERTRKRNRDRYREAHGIPLDAPLSRRGRPRLTDHPDTPTHTAQTGEH